jgi:nitroimidazol reductase NimA-like FMN-containing flavoprotein (pyridoxamine 5'-phosphate oxidase superfamily)
MPDVTNAELPAMGRELIDTTLFMALGTTCADGLPWVSPVYFAPNGYVEFYWVSVPDVTHSLNIAQRPQVSIVVFDSRQRPGSGLAVYMSGTASPVAEDDIDRALEIFNNRFPNPADYGLRSFTREQVEAPAPIRLYRATVSQHSMLCRKEIGQPCVEHGRPGDHRTEVIL